MPKDGLNEDEKIVLLQMLLQGGKATEDEFLVMVDGRMTWLDSSGLVKREVCITEKGRKAIEELT
jgi:hypothetical protein